MEHANSIILSLQRTIGNQAVSSLAHGRVGSVVESRPAKATQSLIQRVRLNATDLLDLTVAAFDRHRQAEQADWSNESLTQTARGLIWDIIEWGPAGLGPILLKDIVNAVQSDGRNRVHLQNYCEALSGKLRGVVTTTVPRVGTLTEVLKTGKWIGELTSALTGPRLKATMPPDRFTELIADEAVATAFIDYYTKKSPVLQTPSGREYEAFVKLVKEEGAKIDDYVADLPTIRNLHKFEKESLDKLKLDKGQKDRPLTLVFVAMFDHNGAFIRHAHVNAVIQHKKLRAFAIEGVDAPAITSLTKTGLAQIAAAHGMDGKITQVMFAGHGNSVNMEAVGQGSDVVNTSGEYKVEPRGQKQLYFGVKSYDDFWTPFFDALFANMEMKGGLQPKILLRACLTASNHVDTDKLKKEMRAKNIIDVDDKSVDPTLPENQAKIRAAIDDYIKTYGSLQSVLTDRAKSRAEILGAQASITSASAGAVNKDTGELEIVPLSDPTVARSKIEYVRFGKEPLGALKAVIEAWARAGPDACFAKMDERVKDPVASESDFIIATLYRVILANYKNDILAANALVNTASAWYEVSKGGADCRASALAADAYTTTNRAVVYPLLLGRFARKASKLTIYEEWLCADAAKQPAFLALLGDAEFTRLNVANYVEQKIVGPYIEAMLARSADSLRGRLLLALVNVTEHKTAAPSAVTFLRGQADTNGAFSPELVAELNGYSENVLRTKLGMAVASVTAATGGTPTKNISTSANVYVEPMRPRRENMTKAGLFDRAQILTEPRAGATKLDDQYFTKEYTLVGEVKKLTGGDAGWYQLRMDNGTVAYMEKRFF